MPNTSVDRTTEFRTVPPTKCDLCGHSLLKVVADTYPPVTNLFQAEFSQALALTSGKYYGCPMRHWTVFVPQEFEREDGMEKPPRCEFHDVELKVEYRRLPVPKAEMTAEDRVYFETPHKYWVCPEVGCDYRIP